MPPTRREQLELDELLSDIYRGIETLPDNKSQQVYTSSNKSLGGNTNLSSRTYTREYELPASSPLVKQHKQELAALRSSHNNSNASNTSNNFTSNKPSKSTLKRQTKAADQQPQSLAAFVTSSTPENKRRVRIFDHPDKLAKGYSSNEEADYNDFDSARVGGEKLRPASKVKYVNTNKLIYHQERNPDDENLNYSEDLNNNHDRNDDDDDDIDGVSRVEYYHTTWLDRQLGRASKRRSSKELNERQVKEKAMIEELKQSLKNGAITLRQSFKSKRNNQSGKHGKPSGTHDDQMLSLGRNSRKAHESSSSSVFGSGLATIPRNYQANGRNSTANRPERVANNNYTLANSSTVNTKAVTPKQTNAATSDQQYPASALPSTSSTTNTHQFDSVYKPAEELSVNYQQELPKQPNYSSRTLPRNHQSNIERSHHSLLQSHYRGDKNFNTLGNSSAAKPTVVGNTVDTMRDNNFRSRNCETNQIYGAKSPTGNQYNKQLEQQQYPIGNTISSIPSATEVVRSALSRSSSQISLNQLNKTINLLPNSPPPYAPSPMTPTQQLRAASPSLSPSPLRSPYQRQQDNLSCIKPSTPSSQYSSRTLDTRTNQPQISGTRTMGRVLPHQQQYHYEEQQQQQQQQQQQPTQYQYNQQPIYANPHASLIQHRMEQQTKGPSRNTASIREFNELDSLLRSLSPGMATHTTNVTPGFTSKPAQPSFGYGFSPAQQSMPNNQMINQPKSDIVYAQVHKQNLPQQQPASNYSKPNEQPKPVNYLQQNYGSNNLTASTQQPFTIDVTNKRDENCLQRQDISEFEPPTELVPSMEDYQNISKLNPVKNHYWYKPNMSRDRAINLLKDKPQGTFIVRDSTSFRGAYGLAVKVSKLPKNVLNNASLRNPNGDPSAELIRHFLIEPTSNGVRLKGYANEPVFGSLPALIYQHSLMELALPCKLLIPRADIEDPKFNHKQKQFYDDFMASKEQAKHNPYDRTSPNGGYRKYPGDVYVHNEHRIIFE